MVLKKWQWLALSLAAVAVTFFALISSLPHLVESRLKAELVGHGVTDFRLGEPSWGLTGAGTTELEIAGSYQQWHYRIRFKQVLASYHWRTLMRGEVTAIAVDSVAIELQQSTAESPASDQIDLEVILNNLAALELPVETINLAGLQLAYADQSYAAMVTGSGLEINSAGKFLSGTLRATFSLPDGRALPQMQVVASPGELSWIPDLAMALQENGRQLLNGTVRLHRAPADQGNRFPYQVDYALAMDNQPLAHLAALFPDPSEKALLEQTTASVDLQGKLALPGVLKTAEGGWFLNLPLDFSAATDLRTSFPDLGIDSLAMQGGLSLSGSAAGLDITAAEGVQVQAELDGDSAALPAEWLDAKGKLSMVGSVALQEPVRVRQTETGETLFSSRGLALQLISENSAPAVSAKLTLSELEYAPGVTRFAFDGAINLPYQGKALPELHIRGTGKEVEAGWQLATTLAIEPWKLSSEARLAFGENSAIDLSGQLQVPEIPLLIQELEKRELLPMELSLASGRGEIRYRAAIRHNKTPALDLDVQAENLTGLAEGVAFDKAALSGAIAKRKQWSTSTPFNLRINQLSPGIVVSDVQLSASLTPSADLLQGRWRLETLDAALFGGKLALAEPAAIDVPFNGNRVSGNRLVFRLSNLQLHEVLSLYQAQGISGNGVLNGEIPVLLEATGLRVSEGFIQAEPPGGNISFSNADARALARSNEQLAMTFRLLENFTYDVLKVGADFQPSGDLTLRATLNGRNPAEFDGRPVNFNISFEDNIFELFQVLKLTDDLTRKIEKRLQKQKLH